MSEIAGHICLRNSTVRRVRQLLAAVQQAAEKRICLAGMCKRADIMPVQHIGGEVIKENIRPLQAERVRGAVVVKILF